MLPEQAAESLGVPEESVEAMEAGYTPPTFADIDLLCRLYGCDADALKGLLGQWADEGPVADAAPGHHRRLAACVRQANKALWIATDHLPPLVHTAAYAHAVGSPACDLPGVPLPFPSRPQLLLDERILLTKDIDPAVMRHQLAYLLDQTDCEMRVMPGRIPDSLGPVVTLQMAAGYLLAESSHHGVRYRADEQPPRSITHTWDLTTPATSQFLVRKALHEQMTRYPCQGPPPP